MKQKKIFDKVMKIFAVMVFILSMCFSQKYANNVEAWDNSTPHEFTRIKQIDYPWWWSSKISSAKKWSTYMCKYDNKYAYCLEASKKSPSAGKYPAQVIENNEAVRKILYYGFGGPGYDQAIKEMYTVELNSCVPDDFGEKHGNFDDGAYLFTHIWLSYAYGGDLMGLNLKDFNAKWPNADGNSGYGDNILWGYNWLMNQPDIGYAYFSPSQDGGVTASFKAEFDKVNKLQKTNIVKLEGTSHSTIQVPLQNNVTLYNVTKGTMQTGGTVTVNGGESFYLTAPCKNSPENYKSGNIAGKGCEMFTALAIKDGAEGTQTEGSWNLDPDGNKLKYEVEWLDFGALRLSKVDNTSKFQKNSKFRLISTSYTGYDETFEVTKDENGQLEMTGIPLGKYQVVEVSCPQGYVLDSTPYDFEITQKDHTTTIYTNSHEQTNQITKTTFTKTDVTGDQEVSGAKMSITDLEGKVIDEWISSNKAHEIDGLESGKTYYLNEDTSPAGYVKATKIEFKVNEDGKIQKVNMKDKVVTISKVTLGGEEIQGALLQVIDEEGNTVDQWYSDGNEHPVSGLEEGKTYTLHEDLAPLGFNLVNDISFTVSYEKENQKIEMIDTFVKVYKQKEDGNLLKGAQLTVVSTKTKNRIDQWITGQHIFDINDVMKKKLLKGDMCQGKNEEGIEYKVVPQLKSNDYFLMLKDGEDVTYYCIDIQGDETAHLIQGLNSGEKYILRETLTPCGYATAKEQIFEIREKNIVLKVVDEDIKVDISKKDITNKKELSGAHLQVKNEDGEVLDSWISTDQEHRICHLEVGKKYILEETMAPYGYEKSEKVEFVIKDTGEIQKVIMYDQPIIQAIKTGDSSKLNYFIMLGALSGICIFLCRKRDVKSPKSK